MMNLRLLAPLAIALLVFSASNALEQQAPAGGFDPLPANPVKTPDPSVSYHATVGSDPGDHQRAQHYIGFVPTHDGTVAETALAIDTAVATGYVTAWRPATVVPAGLLVEVNDCVFRAMQAGRSADTGTGPAPPGCPFGAITPGRLVDDGSVVWSLQSHAESDAKSALFLTTAVNKGAGNSWGLINDVVVNPGVQATNVFGAEFDYSNLKGDCLPTGAGSCANLFLFGNTAYPATAAISIGTPATTPTHAQHFGILMNGANLNKDADLSLNSSATVAIDVNGLLPGHHATAAIRDNSTAPTSVLVAGTHPHAAIDTSNARTPNALVAAAGQQLCFDGVNACFRYDEAKNKLYYIKDGVALFSIADSTGDLIVKGSIKTGTP